MRKRIRSCFLVFILVLVSTACSSANSKENSAEISKDEDTPEYYVQGNEEYEILEENISTAPRSVYDNELLSEFLASDLKEAQELLDAGITNVPLTAEYFTFDFNDDGTEDYVVSYDGAGWSGVLGNAVSLYIQEDDGLRQVFSCTVRFHVGEGEYVPLTVLKEKTDGFYSFKFAGYDVIWRYDAKDGWYGE